MRYAVLCSRVRVEEKALFDALNRRGVPFDRVDPRRLSVELDGRALAGYEAVLVRCISHTRAYYMTRWLNELGVRTVNSHETVACCGDKLMMSLAFRRAGLRPIGWHKLRHTFASHLAMHGVPLKTIQELLGHASPMMTNRYSHLSPTVCRDAVVLLDQPAPKKEEQGHDEAAETQSQQNSSNRRAK